MGGGRRRLVALLVAVVVVGAGCDWLQWANGPGHPGSGFEPGITPSAVQDLVASPIDDRTPTTPAVIAGGLVVVATDDSLVAYHAGS